jgi:hypothetical protein
LWALKSRLQVLLANVAAVAPAESEAREWLHGIRLGGTHIPGVITAGRFYSHGKWAFWDVHDPAKAIGIELRNEHYSKLIVEVGNPEDQISQIRQATGQTLGSNGWPAAAHLKPPTAGQRPGPRTHRLPASHRGRAEPARP